MREDGGAEPAAGAAGGDAEESYRFEFTPPAWYVPTLRDAQVAGSGHGDPAAPAPGMGGDTPKSRTPPDATSGTASGAGLSVGRDVRVTGLGGGVTAGLVHTVHNYQAPAAPVRLPYRLGRVPALARDFLERDIPELAGPDVTGPPLVLAGTAGAGKTQLAARFAEDAWAGGHLRFLLWVEAGSRESVAAAYTRAAQDLLGRPFPDAADGAQAFLNWCRPAGGTQPHPWLVVLDGVTDPADLADLWPPASPYGRVFVTSRRRDAGAAVEAVVAPVRGFTVEEARAYLERALDRRGLGSPEDDDVARLVEQAGGRASFLRNAAELAVRDGTPLDTYLDVVGGGPAEVPFVPSPLWRSVEAAQQTAPGGLAVPVLRLLAFYGADGVPEDALLTEKALRALRELGEDGADSSRGEVTRREVRATLQVLHRLSLTEKGQCGPYTTVRAETRTAGVAMSRLDPDAYTHHSLAAADILAAAWPETEPGADAARLFRSAANAMADYPSRVMAVEGIHPVVFRLGRSLGAWGRPAEARGLFVDYTTYGEHFFDFGHPDVLRARSRAARWLGVQGSDEAAAVELAEVLADQRRVLPADHPDILTTRHCLAWCRLSATSWDVEEPRAELAAVLRERIRALGPDHADTLVTLYAIVRAALSREEQTAGGVDVRAAAERLNIPEVPGEEGTFDRLDLVEALHGELERIVGLDHPATLNACRNLALVHSQRHDDGTARNVAASVLEDALRVVGPEHPLTLDARVSAALITRHQDPDGDAREGLDALSEALVSQAEVIGPSHPDTLLTTEFRLDVREERVPDVGKGEFLTDYADLLAEAERVFGRGHRRTRQLLLSLARVQAAARRYVPALVSLADLLSRNTRVLGPTHRATLAVRCELARQRGAAGDKIGAVVGLAETASEQTSVLGADHPDTLTTRRHLAWFRGMSGDRPGAVEELTGLLAAHERTTGPDTPEAGRVRDALDTWHPIRLRDEDG